MWASFMAVHTPHPQTFNAEYSGTPAFGTSSMTSFGAGLEVVLTKVLRRHYGEWLLRVWPRALFRVTICAPDTTALGTHYPVGAGPALRTSPVSSLCTSTYGAN